MIPEQEYCWQDVELAFIDLARGDVSNVDEKSLRSRLSAVTGYWYSTLKNFCKYCGMEGVVSKQMCNKCYTNYLENAHYA